MKNRLFVALKLPEEIIDEIISMRKIINDDTSHRWEPKEKIHLTIKFLGGVDENKTDKIIHTLESVLDNREKIKCGYDRFGFFLPRILWINISADKSLFETVNEFEDEFEKIGFPKESRKFKPHITLLRIKDIPEPDFVSAFNNFKLPDKIFYAEDISLMKSKLIPSGSVYTILKTYKLL